MPCVAENPIDSAFIPLTNPTSCKSLEARACRGSKCNVLGSSWHGLRATAPRRWPINSSATKPRFGERVVGIKPTASLAYSPTAGKNIRGDRPRFPPLQRAQIVELACLEPVAKGLHITHWSSEDLARQAVADGIVGTISPRTIRRILDDVDLQPHRTRYWRTTRADSRFKERAEKVLWCYGNAARLATCGIWVVCADEMPNCQVLERVPIRRAIPGSIEQVEYDYTRHGTVNILNFLIVHSGKMEAVCLEANDAENYVAALRYFRSRHHWLNAIYLVHDGGPSHIAQSTKDYFARCHTWWRPCLTPARASWLDQAELLNHAFDRRYLKRGSWASRVAYIEHLMASWPEYNRLYAHPFEWTWSNHKMRKWYARHAT
jgi:hypothetical protein